MREQFANDARSTLNGAINDTVTSLTVASASDFPTTGNFRILVGNEIMLVTNVSTNTFTVVRGQESTSAAAHSDGALVSQIITAGGLKQIIFDDVLFAGQKKLYHSITDSSGSVLEASDFTWVNQGDATVTDVDGTIYLTCGTASGNDIRALTRPIPSTPYTITMGWRPALTNNEGGTDGFPAVVTGWRDSTTGRLCVPCLVFRDDGLGIRWMNFNSPTSYSGNVTNSFQVTWGYDCWLRLSDDGVDFSAQFSVDGNIWINWATYTRTTWTASPDQTLIGIDPAAVDGAGNPGQAATLFHYSVT